MLSKKRKNYRHLLNKNTASVFKTKIEKFRQIVHLLINIIYVRLLLKLQGIMACDFQWSAAGGGGGGGEKINICLNLPVKTQHSTKEGK
jgi:hypothetical protein